jgi:hypothetical protein
MDAGDWMLEAELECHRIVPVADWRWDAVVLRGGDIAEEVRSRAN